MGGANFLPRSPTACAARADRKPSPYRRSRAPAPRAGQEQRMSSVTSWPSTPANPPRCAVGPFDPCRREPAGREAAEARGGKDRSPEDRSRGPCPCRRGPPDRRRSAHPRPRITGRLKRSARTVCEHMRERADLGEGKPAARPDRPMAPRRISTRWPESAHSPRQNLDLPVGPAAVKDFVSVIRPRSARLPRPPRPTGPIPTDL